VLQLTITAHAVCEQSSGIRRQTRVERLRRFCLVANPSAAGYPIVITHSQRNLVSNVKLRKPPKHFSCQRRDALIEHQHHLYTHATTLLSKPTLGFDLTPLRKEDACSARPALVRDRVIVACTKYQVSHSNSQVLSLEFQQRGQIW